MEQDDLRHPEENSPNSAPPRVRPDRNDPPLPERVGRFRITGRLGAGAYGVVYRAEDPQLRRPVALKVLLQKHLGDDAAVRLRRFEQEARIAANLAHPHVVQIYDAGTDGEYFYYAMELVEGQPLSALIRRHPEGVPPKEAAQLLLQVAGGLAEAHRHGIVHRDVKPGNILIGPDGQAKVTDFGLALDAASGSSLTRTGDVMGTALYLAPEQAAGHTHQLTAAADVHALGAVGYEMLTGRPLFAGDTMVGIVFRIVDFVPPPFSRQGVRVPYDLETILLKCLDKAPERRYCDAGELAADLQRFLDFEPIATRRAGWWYRWRKTIWKHRLPVAAALVAAAALALAAWLGWGLLDRMSRFAAGWRLVTEEDFHAGILPPGWRVTHGRARVEGGSLTGQGDDQYGFMVLLPGDCPDIVRLEYDAWFPEASPPGPGGSDLSCALHCDPANPVDTGYLLQFGAIYNRRSQICRDGPDLVRNDSPAACVVPGRRHHVTVEHVGETIRLEVDGTEILRLRDFFPARGGRVALYSWGGGGRFDNVRLYRRDMPLDVSCLAVPDAFYERGEYDEAARLYQAILQSHPDTPEGQAARYKYGLARLTTGKDGDAGRAFRALEGTELAGWAWIGLAELDVRRGRSDLAVAELDRARRSGDAEAAGLVQANAIRLFREAASRGDVAGAAALIQYATRSMSAWEQDRLIEQITALGIRERRAGQGDSALALHEAAMAVFARNPRLGAHVRQVCGLSLLEGGRWVEARDLFAGLAGDPSVECSWRAWSRLWVAAISARLAEPGSRERMRALFRRELAAIAAAEECGQPPSFAAVLLYFQGRIGLGGLQPHIAADVAAGRQDTSILCRKMLVFLEDSVALEEWDRAIPE